MNLDSSPIRGSSNGLPRRFELRVECEPVGQRSAKLGDHKGLLDKAWPQSQAEHS